MQATLNFISTIIGETTPLLKHRNEQPLAPVHFSFIPPIEKTLKITYKITQLSPSPLPGEGCLPAGRTLITIKSNGRSVTWFRSFDQSKPANTT